MSEVSYRPLIDGMTWSYSRIKCFEDCRYRWFLKYIRNLEDIPMFYSSYGSFMHKLIEMYYNGELSKEDMKIKFLFDYRKEILGVRPPEETALKYIRAGLKYLDRFEPFPFEMISVEKKVDFFLQGERFVGFIDYLGEKDGEYYIVDNKSRDLKPRSNRKKPTLKDKELDESLRQLYIYSAAVKQEFGKFPKELCFNCYRTGEFIREPFNEDAYNEAVEWALGHIEAIKNASDFYPYREFFSCYYLCGLNEECVYWQER